LQNESNESLDFFCTIIWKANRAKSRIANRPLKFNPNLNEGIKDLTNKTYQAKEDKGKLKILLVNYGFRLPMASAILSLLYPKNFTVYNIRVCDTFPNYEGIHNLTFEKLWTGYSNYIDNVRNYGNLNLSLRDKDRLLWGKSFCERLNSDLKTEFKRGCFSKVVYVQIDKNNLTK
jgi:hypothetical protein